MCVPVNVTADKRRLLLHSPDDLVACAVSALAPYFPPLLPRAVPVPATSTFAAAPPSQSAPDRPPQPASPQLQPVTSTSSPSGPSDTSSTLPGVTSAAQVTLQPVPAHANVSSTLLAPACVGAALATVTPLAAAGAATDTGVQELAILADDEDLDDGSGDYGLAFAAQQLPRGYRMPLSPPPPVCVVEGVPAADDARDTTAVTIHASRTPSPVPANTGLVNPTSCVAPPVSDSPTRAYNGDGPKAPTGGDGASGGCGGAVVQVDLETENETASLASTQALPHRAVPDGVIAGIASAAGTFEGALGDYGSAGATAEESASGSGGGGGVGERPMVDLSCAADAVSSQPGYLVTSCAATRGKGVVVELEEGGAGESAGPAETQAGKAMSRSPTRKRSCERPVHKLVNVFSQVCESSVRKQRRQQ